jgi:diguanylate cyclase (GGDEF)-like protein
MSTTTHSIPRIERAMAPSWPLALASTAALALGLGLIGSPARPWWVSAAAVGALLGAGAWAARRLMDPKRRELGWMAELELGALALVPAAIIARQVAPGTDLSTLTCFALAALCALLTPRAAALCVAMAAGLEGLGQLGALVSGAPGLTVAAALTHVAMYVAFGALSRVVYGAELIERRRRHKQEVAREREALLREAREFRLIHAGKLDADASAERERVEELVMRDAVEAVHQSTYVSLRLLKGSLGCHTCVLLWMDTRGESLSIKELVSDSDHLYEGALEPARGVLGGITRRREAVILADLREGFRGLCYYKGQERVKHFLGVPVLESGHLRGILCVDRVTDRAFTHRDVELVEEAAEYILRATQNERLFAQVEKARAELARFFEATRRLNHVLTPQDAYTVALELVSDAVPVELIALTMFDRSSNTHTIMRVAGVLGDKLEADRTFKANSGLVSMVVKNRHYLPYGGQAREQTPVIFEESNCVDGLKSLLVMPLVVQDQVIGTLVLGHRQPGQYTQERREVLEVVCTQVAITLQNANLYAQMEDLATKDALTGLANRRTFMMRMDEALARHKRTQRAFAVVISDIDHFKSVNDTYGHPMGDEVLRQVAACFKKTLRETDFPARYGGEEFVIVLEETDEQGALVITNRLREEISKLVFQTEKGPLKVTISMGVSLYPAHGQDRQQLIDLADQALYVSKKGGRNRVTLAGR